MLVLHVSVTVLDAGVGAAQATGVCVVGLGVLLVRGVGRGGGARHRRGLRAAVGVHAAYTLVDKDGIEHADPIVYLEPR